MSKKYLYGGLPLAVIIGIVVALAHSFYKTKPVAPTAEFGGVSLRIEYALSEAEREKGLGGRETIPNDYGMLFIFPKDAAYGFWMKDTLVPLDIFWLGDQGQVVSIARNVAISTYPNVFYPSVPARYVLETASGFADRYGVATGTLLRLKSFPTVSE